MPDEMDEEMKRRIMREMGSRGGSKKTEKTKKRGLASLSKTRRRQIAKMGGKARASARKAEEKPSESKE